MLMAVHSSVLSHRASQARDPHVPRFLFSSYSAEYYPASTSFIALDVIQLRFLCAFWSFFASLFFESFLIFFDK